MKNYINIFVCIVLLLFFANNINAQPLASSVILTEGFNNDNCDYEGHAFYEGCIPSWISTNANPNISSGIGSTAPIEGSKYANLYARWKGNNCSSSSASQSEGIALEYDFEAGNSYEITFAIKCKGFDYCDILNAKWILTNNQTNTDGPSIGCSNESTTPEISSSDSEVWGAEYTTTFSDWVYVTQSFVPSQNYSQLWFRPELEHKSNCGSGGDYEVSVNLDDFVLSECTNESYTTDFAMSVSGSTQGGVQVLLTCGVNFLYYNNLWDIYYAPNGVVPPSGAEEVPGNPEQVNTNVCVFTNNLVVNEWYFIKHGVWNECTEWQETRKRFMVAIDDGVVNPGGGVSTVGPGHGGTKDGTRGGSSGGTYSSGGYRIIVEDVQFEPAAEYTARMTELVRSGKLPNENIDQEPVVANKVEQLTTKIASQNYPNPFALSTTIDFTVEQETPVSIFVTDATGKQMAVLLDEEVRSKGSYQVVFDGSQYPSGIYYYSVIAGNHQTTQKMILMK